MAVTTTNTNKPINPRGDDKSPLAFNRAKIYSGKALDFDGVNDYVDLDGFTMAGNVATIVFQANFSNGAYILDINTQRFVVLNNATNGLGVYDSNAWSYYGHTDRAKVGFYAIVSDGTTQRAYYNGHQLGEDKTIVAIDWDSITEMALGSNNNGTGNFFDGQIAGFKIFNTALTAAQVLDLYNNPEKIVPTGVDNTALKLWLPMMEGAGTTAYDGSGNGNHGTISGATWTHGIGAPVAQSAVIDWNKGTNLLLQSNQFDTTWTTAAASLTSGQSGYDGSSDAWLLESDSDGANRRVKQTTTASGISTFSVYAKEGSVDNILLYHFGANSGRYFDLNPSTTGSRIGSNWITTPIDSKIEDVGGGWFRCSIVVNASVGEAWIYPIATDGSTTTTAGDNIYIQDAQLESASTAGPYVLTFSTAQSSEVLIPQSLTSGRDLFYNSFENARKQYALNLDGQSWAEVHDNESLDFGTGSFSLEAWARVNYVNQGSAFNVILGLGGNASDAGRTFLYYNGTFNIAAFTYSNNSSASLTQTIGDWVHLVGSYDGTNATLYLNGVQVDQDARTAVDMTNDLVKMIGRDITAVRYYNDQIAQPRIYNRALTADEVQQNYNAGKNTYS